MKFFFDDHTPVTVDLIVKAVKNANSEGLKGKKFKQFSTRNSIVNRCLVLEFKFEEIKNFSLAPKSKRHRLFQGV